ncbi:MAG TPA: hypothetical protein VES40_11820 [Ilumatobacteraceae bacterium]|nr:hypothetical protein [Ilumatobacteraceae bacterium]
MESAESPIEHEHEPPVTRRLTTPRAAAVAGIAFSVLMGTALVLLRLAVPSDPGDSADWLDDSAGQVKFAIALVPFAGIAFLWFIGVIRDRLGDLEDRFFASVLFGSGLLYLAMTFVSTAIVGGLIAAYEVNPDLTIDGGVYAFAREVVTRVSNIFGVRMGAVFMISTATIWFRSGSMPRWVILLTYLLALVQLVTITLSLWLAILFPLWVLIVSLHFLIRASGHQPETAAAPL